MINNQNTSSECGQSAATCPGLSQSSQKISPVLGREFIPMSSLSILQLKISWPGRSHISHTWPLTLVTSELSLLLDTLLSRFLPSSKSWLLLEFFLCRDVISLSRSISCSSSSCDHDSVLSTEIIDFSGSPLYKSDINLFSNMTLGLTVQWPTFDSTKASNSLISLLSYKSFFSLFNLDVINMDNIHIVDCTCVFYFCFIWTFTHLFYLNLWNKFSPRNFEYPRWLTSSWVPRSFDLTCRPSSLSGFGIDIFSKADISSFKLLSRFSSRTRTSWINSSWPSIANQRKQSHLTKLLGLGRQELVLGLRILDSLYGGKVFFL